MEYNTRRSRGGFISRILLGILFIILILIMLLWIFPTKSYFNSLFQDVFRNNINSMREAGEKYYTNERLPKNVGDVEKITLREMLDKNLLLPFTDKNGKSCNLDKSYIKITKNDTEYEMKVYLSCNDESAYIITYLGCKDYCYSLGQCDKTCGCNADKCSKKTLYEYERPTTKKEITGYKCDSGYTKKGSLCYKTTTTKESKEATPVYETTTKTEIAKPKYNTKKVKIDATPVYSDDEKYEDATALYTTKKVKIDATPVYGNATDSINATPHTITNQVYKYLYTKKIEKEYSNWSDWSANKEYDPNNNNIVWGQQELVWNEKNGAKKVTTTKTVYDKSQPIFETSYDTVIGSYKRYACSGFNYYMDTTSMTVYQYGNWVSEGESIYTSVPTSTNPNVKYVFVSMAYECNGDCIETPKYIFRKMVRTATKAITSTSNNLTVSCNVTEQTIPVYGMTKNFVGYVSDKVTTTSYVYYYHTKTRTITQQASTDSKWTYTYNDSSLVNNGYTYVRSEVESENSSTYYTCPTGYTLNGTKCYKTTSKITGYTCPAGYTLNGKSCEKEEKYISGYTCPVSYTLSGTKCYKKTSKITGYTCPASYTLNGKSCEKEEKYISGYTCPTGYTLSGTTCYKKSDSKLIGYKCSSNAYTLNGKKCERTVTKTSSIQATPIYKNINVTEYRWSEKALDGWNQTGNKKIDTVCE